MKKVVLVLLLAGVVGCASSKTEDEAVDEVREALDVPVTVDDSEVRIIMHDSCNVMDDHDPQEVVDRLELPPAVVKPLLFNAAEVYCPEHLKAVVQYMTKD